MTDSTSHLFSADAAPGAPRAWLDARREDLYKRFQKGVGGADLVSRGCRYTDELVIAAWQARGLQLVENAALIAVGGYGRRELLPWADVDIVVIINDDSPACREAVETFLRSLWDTGLDLGHTVLTPSQIIEHAASRVDTATSLFESRMLAGSGALYEQFREAIANPDIWPPQQYVSAKRAEQEQRHTRYSDTGSNLEPNIKESPGGLRDLHTIAWIARRLLGPQQSSEAIEETFLSAAERREIRRARNFLWRLRVGLHLLAGRKEDRLQFDYQRELADQMGFESRDNAMAVEQLMKRYYRTAKVVRLYNEMLIQDLMDSMKQPDEHQVINLSSRYRIVDGYLDIRGDTLFERHPDTLIELFVAYQKNIRRVVGIRARTIRLLRAALPHFTQQLRNQPACRQHFMAIMRSPGRIYDVLRRMNNYGLLGHYVPAFGAISGQMQHDLFHIYTVDAHTLFVVRNLRQFANDKLVDELPDVVEIMDQLVKPERIYLAGLFHDIAKGRGGDHSILGEPDAVRFCKQHGLSDYDARFVGWLVRFHLTMSQTAQREDISDPAVIRRFAEQVGDREHLDNLYLLTIADIRATNPTLWNNWKRRLLSDLYANTGRFLRMNVSEGQEASERVAARKKEVRTLYQLGNDASERFWQLADGDYFTRTDSDSLGWQTEALINASASDIPCVHARLNKGIGVNQIFVYAPDTEKLLPLVASGTERLRLT
ncbi:[protein-PII] uridylyltransferase, partial [Gammaproteobacteria bacterium]|nr:[protein-PII] uridylyltransferase [Gammaproteobacteria bacterium]